MLPSLCIQASEWALLQAVRRLEYGELHDLTLTVTGEKLYQAIHGNEKALLDLGRGGVQHLRVLVVHQGLPTYAEVDHVDGDYRGTKKYRF
jgi:hypothetical protein